MYVNKSELTCKEAEKMIPLYIEDHLDINELETFMNHVETCESCKEELSIQFLVSTGLKSLEAGNNFDLNYELLESLDFARRKIHKKRLFQRILAGTIIIAVLAIAIAVAIWLCFWV